jgi:hypothetical protein
MCPPAVGGGSSDDDDAVKDDCPKSEMAGATKREQHLYRSALKRLSIARLDKSSKSEA